MVGGGRAGKKMHNCSRHFRFSQLETVFEVKPNIIICCVLLGRWWGGWGRGQNNQMIMALSNRRRPKEWSARWFNGGGGDIQ